MGLLVGITAGVSFAENPFNTLPGTDLIDKRHTQSISLVNAINFVEAITGKHNYNAAKHYYYNFKCYINNLLYPAEMNISIQQLPNFLNGNEEFSLNDEKISANNGIITGMLKAGNNVLELKKLSFPAVVKDAGLKFSTTTIDYPGMGYKVDYCTYNVVIQNT